MIQIGDRITTVIPCEDMEDVSGIVGLAVDIGHGDWMVLVYEGQRDIGGRPGPVFSSEFVSLYHIDVVERGCAFPEIPEKVRQVYRRSVEYAAKKMRKKWPNIQKAVDHVYRGLPPMSTEVTAQVIANFGDNEVTEGTLRATLTEMMVNAARHTTPAERPGDHVTHVVLAAMLRRVDVLVADLKRGGVKVIPGGCK